MDDRIQKILQEAYELHQKGDAHTKSEILQAQILDVLRSLLYEWHLYKNTKPPKIPK